jgi:hypothetical protein
MCQVSYCELGLSDPCFDLFVDVAEHAFDRGFDCGSQAGAQEKVVDASEEQGDAQSLADAHDAFALPEAAQSRRL